MGHMGRKQLPRLVAGGCRQRVAPKGTLRKGSQVSQVSISVKVLRMGNKPELKAQSI